MPRIPSSFHMTFAVPTRPLYIMAWPTYGLLVRCTNPPCACSFVLMTSRGQVTTPEVKPPTAPDKALNWDSWARAAQRSKEVMPVGVCVVEGAEVCDDSFGGIMVDIGAVCP